MTQNRYFPNWEDSVIFLRELDFSILEKKNVDENFTELASLR